MLLICHRKGNGISKLKKKTKNKTVSIMYQRFRTGGVPRFLRKNISDIGCQNINNVGQISL